jgi:chromosome segregation ATPase
MSMITTSKTPLLFSLLALIAGGAIGYGVGIKVEKEANAPDLLSCQQHLQSQMKRLDHSTEQYQILVASNEKQSQQLAQTTKDLTVMTELMDKQKKEFSAQLALLTQKKQKLVATKQKLEVTKKKLDTEVVKLQTTTTKQQVMIDKSQQYFKRQAEMQANVQATEANVAELKQAAKGFKKACDEFKSGNSWNWVSQKDCDNYDQQLGLLKDKQALLGSQQQALSVINAEIGKE